ncbi:MAG TPA: hypothetical protein VMG35_20485 [Bryobacteraceae bacterium]|nr:hypothetical protein [Bryobacteraceae bacterium]
MQPPTIFAVIVLLGALALLLLLLNLRHRKEQMLHQERMAALEKGVAVPEGREPAPWSPRVYLLRGLIWTFGGAAVVICLLGLAAASRRPPSAESLAWSAQNVSRALDIPLDQARQIVEKDRAAHEQGMPAGVALLGLIPLGVGLAYLVFYYSDPARPERKELAAGPERL